MVRLSGLDICLFSFAGCLWGTPAFSAPALVYQTSSGDADRQLIFSNNPEEIRAEKEACDVADGWMAETVCSKVLLRLEGVMGNFRDWWEHANKTAGEITYAVRVYNPDWRAARVRLRGSGFAPDAAIMGGREFVELFSATDSHALEVSPGATVYLFRSRPIPSGQFFSGVVDFDIEGAPLVVDNLAYVREPAPLTSYTGYERRQHGLVRESLVYKGLSPHSEAVAQGLDFEVDDGMNPQRLPVAFRRFELPPQHEPPREEGMCQENERPLCKGEKGKFGDELVEASSWVTHIGPDPLDPNPKRALAVVSDMVAFLMPSFPEGCRVGLGADPGGCIEISPFFKWWHGDVGEWRHPNLGNWAVVYRLKGSVRNAGSRPRRVHLGVRGDGISPLAYHCNSGSWASFLLTRSDPDNPTDYFPYCEFTVPPGRRVPFSGELVLSGPATGTLEQLVRLVN